MLFAGTWSNQEVPCISQGYTAVNPDGLIQVKADPGGLPDDQSMTGTAMSTKLPSDPGPLPRMTAPAPASPAFWPKEHGSWSLALEPVALGLLVAPSPAGLALATAALARAAR